jgi:hypothetical protein
MMVPAVLLLLMGSLLLLLLLLPQVTPEGRYLTKGAARIQVDVVPLPDGSKAVGVNYFRENTQFMASPVSPVPPTPM